MNKKLERGELTATLTFALALLVMLLATWVSGCGDAGTIENDGVPFVEISCDEPVDVPRCFVLAYNATSVEAFYNGRLAWWDRDASGERRLTYIDAPGRVVFAVEACNALDCTVDVVDLR